MGLLEQTLFPAPWVKERYEKEYNGDLIGSSTNQELFQIMHRKIVAERLHLTGSQSFDFVTSLFPGLTTAWGKFESYAVRLNYDITAAANLQLKDHVDLLVSLSGAVKEDYHAYIAQLVHYLHVLYNLMQEEMSPETERDSSAMKSIALLTIAFLPATALATIIAPFLTFEAHSNKFTLNPEFDVFLKIAAPVTILVVIVYAIWIQRGELKRQITGNKRARSVQDATRGNKNRNQATTYKSAPHQPGSMSLFSRLRSSHDAEKADVKLPVTMTQVVLQPF